MQPLAPNNPEQLDTACLHFLPYLPRDQFPLVQEKQVEEYKVTVTLADGKDSSDSSDGATKLPLTMAKLETLTDRRSDEAISVQC